MACSELHGEEWPDGKPSGTGALRSSPRSPSLFSENSPTLLRELSYTSPRSPLHFSEKSLTLLRELSRSSPRILPLFSDSTSAVGFPLILEGARVRLSPAGMTAGGRHEAHKKICLVYLFWFIVLVYLSIKCCGRRTMQMFIERPSSESIADCISISVPSGLKVGCTWSRAEVL